MIQYPVIYPLYIRSMYMYKTGWWFQPPWKILVSWNDYSQYMESHKKCSKPPTSYSASRPLRRHNPNVLGKTRKMDGTWLMKRYPTRVSSPMVSHLVSFWIVILFGDDKQKSWKDLMWTIWHVPAYEYVGQETACVSSYSAHFHWNHYWQLGCFWCMIDELHTP